MNVPQISKERNNKDNSRFETIRQLAKRHMMDQYHTTTDEELKNAVVELDADIFSDIKDKTALTKKR